MDIQYDRIVDYKNHPMRTLYVQKYIKTSFKLLARSNDQSIDNFA